MSEEMRGQLKTLKDRDGISESEAIRRAVAEFLKARKIGQAETKGRKRTKKA